MATSVIVTFGGLAGICVVAGTALFWRIYVRASYTAKQLKSGMDAMETISDEKFREMFRRGIDVEFMLKDQKLARATAKLLSTPFERQWMADWGFGLYVAGAMFGTIATIVAATR